MLTISIGAAVALLAKIFGGFVLSLIPLVYCFAPSNDKDPAHPFRNYLICLAFIYFMIFYGYEHIQFTS